MARPLRVDIADGVYHVTSRGLERRKIVRSDQDRRKWVSVLSDVAARHDWRVYAWTLMENHFHLFLRTPNADLSRGMHDLNAWYVTWFNRRHGRCGPLFQGRYKATLVERDYHAWDLTRYVHLNPVRAALSERPDTYEWGSCPAYFRTELAPDWLAWEEVLRQHGRTVRAAQAEYARFLMDGLARPPRSPLAEAVAGTLLGSPRFLDRMKTWLQGRLPDREVPAARTLRRQVSVAEVQRAVCDQFSVKLNFSQTRGKRGSDPRAAAVYLCRRLTQAPVREIGLQFGGVSGQAVSNLVAKAARHSQRDREFAAKVAAVERYLRGKCETTT